MPCQSNQKQLDDFFNNIMYVEENVEENSQREIKYLKNL
jgi:hypothetical protein